MIIVCCHMLPHVADGLDWMTFMRFPFKKYCDDRTNFASQCYDGFCRVDFSHNYKRPTMASVAFDVSIIRLMRNLTTGKFLTH